jgi:hypothetical protein
MSGSMIAMISDGVSSSLSTGASWGSWAYSYLPGVSGALDVVGTIWGGIGGAAKIYEGYQQGNKTKMAVGTVMVLMSTVGFLPESLTGVVTETALGGFDSILPSINYAMFEMPDGAKEALGYLVPGVPVAFGATLKLLGGDDLAANDDGVGALFALLTAVANAYEKYPSKYLQVLAQAQPELEKLIPLYGTWRDKGDMWSFITTNASLCAGYVANVASFALNDAAIPPATSVGKQVVTNAGKGARRKKRKGRRRR